MRFWYLSRDFVCLFFFVVNYWVSIYLFIIYFCISVVVVLIFFFVGWGWSRGGGRFCVQEQWFYLLLLVI